MCVAQTVLGSWANWWAAQPEKRLARHLLNNVGTPLGVLDCAAQLIEREEAWFQQGRPTSIKTDAESQPGSGGGFAHEGRMAFTWMRDDCAMHTIEIARSPHKTRDRDSIAQAPVGILENQIFQLWPTLS